MNKDMHHDSLGRYIGVYGDTIDFSVEAAIYTNVRIVRDFPKESISFYDISTLYAKHDVLHAMIEEIVSLHKGKFVSKVIGLEARGFVLLGAVADALHAGAVMARKPEKLPLVGNTATYEKEYGVDSISIPADTIVEEDTVLIHDDILATGGTAKAAIQLAKEAGAKKVLFNCIIEIVSEGLEGRKAISEAYPDVVITSLIKL